ncbi:helix-turn-helix protein [Legionella shakespearei DSM 23087]|uniref:Helix-turn-helix protein n=2 Tax=Legionella shakespearei TaxID=45075 RepID=A0A0W0YV81_9GAMM|nr:helix-turn-helix protein [Legionella shakespearei DSM 23087]
MPPCFYINIYYNIHYMLFCNLMDIMMSFFMQTPQEMLKKIAEKARTKRLSLDLSQQTLSKKSGVSYSVIKKFEQTGKISLESLLKLALTLDSLIDFDAVFLPRMPEQAMSLDELMQESKRKRGRK